MYMYLCIGTNQYAQEYLQYVVVQLHTYQYIHYASIHILIYWFIQVHTCIYQYIAVYASTKEFEKYA